jgi:hypothetical protein
LLFNLKSLIWLVKAAAGEAFNPPLHSAPGVAKSDAAAVPESLHGVLIRYIAARRRPMR